MKICVIAILLGSTAAIYQINHTKNKINGNLNNLFITSNYISRTFLYSISLGFKNFLKFKGIFLQGQVSTLHLIMGLNIKFNPNPIVSYEQTFQIFR